MNNELATSPLRLSSRRQHGRAINAVAELFRRQLRVPEIYLDPRIPGFQSADVLAVDQAGSGDLHAAEVKETLVSVPSRAQLRKLLAEVMEIPFHFRYLALPWSTSEEHERCQRFGDYPELFDGSGIGRVGVIAFNHAILQSSAQLQQSVINIVVRPERFRVQGEKLAAVEKFLAKSKPDMAIRL
jgi:hypothetical protein